MSVTKIQLAVAASVLLASSVPALAHQSGSYRDGRAAYDYGDERVMERRLPPRIVERPVYVERKVVVERPVYVDRPVYVERPVPAYEPRDYEPPVYEPRVYGPAPVAYPGAVAYPHVREPNVLGAGVGAAVGAVIGSQIGHGPSRGATTAVGAIIGGVLGSQF